MSELPSHSTIATRSADMLTIRVEKIKQLKGQKSDVVQALVRVEFGEKLLGESQKVECSLEQPADLNFTATMPLSTEDPLAIDDLASKPIICTVVEVLPKEKKQKEEKSVILGQCSIGLFPILTGELTFRITVPICAVPGSPLESLSPEQPRPELEIVLSVNEPLLAETQLQSSNIASITVASLYSPPENWTPANAGSMTYIAALPLPLATDKENVAVFAGGQLRPGPEKEVPNRRRKWAVPGAAVGGAVFIEDRLLATDTVEEESGDLKTKEDLEHRTMAERDKLRVTWNIERRCYMDGTGVKILRDKIAKHRYWPVEVFRVPQNAPAAGGKGGKAKDDDNITFHGVAYVDMSPLIYPGVTRIAGAYRVTGYNEQELLDKTNRRGGIAEDAARIATSILTRNASPGPKAGKKEDLKAQPAKDKKTSTITRPSMSATPKSLVSRNAENATGEFEPAAVNNDDLLYTEAKSYIMLEICLHRPLVPKREGDELAKRVAEYIPPRPLFPKRTNCAQKAVEDFHNQVAIVASMLLDEFREQFGDTATGFNIPGRTSESLEEKRQKLVYHLNTSGKYVAFKEQLKYAVVKIVREKYLRTTNLTDNNELQAFLSELYVYLVDEMHVGLNKVLSIEDEGPVPPPVTDLAQLKHFAREAEVNGNLDLATRFYQERIARSKNDPDCWLDYGTFCLYVNDLTKAEECFKECVAIDQKHLHGLLLNGVVCTMQDKNEAAETFFEAAVTFQPQSILAWTMFGLYYDGIGNEIGVEMALGEANKLNMAAAVAAAKALKEGEEAKVKVDVVEEQTSLAMIEMPPETADSKDKEKEKEKEVNADGEPTHTTMALSTVPSTEGSREALRILSASRASAATVSQKRITSASSHRGDLGKKSGQRRKKRSPQQGKGKDAALAAEAEVQPPPEPVIVPSESVYMQIVEFLLDSKATPFTERALAHHLVDSLGGPSLQYYIAMAMLHLQTRSMEVAEESIQSALQIDYQNPDAWAILGHIKYLVGDMETAKNCYQRTLSFIADASEMHSIYLRLASIYLQEGQFRAARDTFLMACKRSPSCVSWLGVGIACYRLGDFCDAEDALTEANILNNLDPEVWAYLCLVCLQTDRQVEAEQSYKYAIKLSLQDEDLLAEINELQQKVGFGNPQL